MKKTELLAHFLVVILLGFTPGCVFIPTPHYYAIGSRQNVTEQSTNMIESGTDTIETVILKLGEPDAISTDERRVAYSSEKIIGQLFVVGVDRDGSELPDVTQYRFLNVMFDDKGVVTNREFSKKQISMLASSIKGEEITFSSRAIWFPERDVEKRSPKRNVFLVSSPMKSADGDLLLTKFALLFFEDGQLLNGQPALCLGYDSIAECRLGNSIYWSHAIIIHTKDNHFHTFDGLSDERIKLFGAFIQSKITSDQSAK